MDGLLTLVILVLVVGAVLAIAVWAIRTLGIPAPFGNIAIVFIVVIGCIWLLTKAVPLLGVSI